jgi:hypothetical protein
LPVEVLENDAVAGCPNLGGGLQEGAQPYDVPVILPYVFVLTNVKSERLKSGLPASWCCKNAAPKLWGPHELG